MVMPERVERKILSQFIAWRILPAGPCGSIGEYDV